MCHLKSQALKRGPEGWGHDLLTQDKASCSVLCAAGGTTAHGTDSAVLGSESLADGLSL